ncbi:MAG: secondary thiamine-phosphate synthase enzyme YjbQ [Candidatus Bipolaricaulaceae bacterium]
MNPVLALSPIVRTHAFTVHTRRSPEFLDITEEVERAVAACGVREGIALVFSCHTTAAVRINENEPLLLRDMEEFLKRLAPRELYYSHNDFAIRTHNMTPEECPNAHAHLQHLLLGASEAVPIQGGKLALGRWQRIFLVELDRPRERRVLVQVVGCA